MIEDTKFLSEISWQLVTFVNVCAASENVAILVSPCLLWYTLMEISKIKPYEESLWNKWIWILNIEIAISKADNSETILI